MHIANLEEIQSLLMQVPKIVDALERKDPQFHDQVKDWLISAEDILQNNRLAVVSKIAVLRGVLISAERGAHPEGIILTGRKTTARKIRDATAADVLKKANDIISNTIVEPTQRFSEGENLIRQLVVMAHHKGLFEDIKKSKGDLSDLKSVWQAIINDPELRPAASQLVAVISSIDVLILLDRAMTAL